MFPNKTGAKVKQYLSGRLLTFLLWGRETVGGKGITMKSELDDAIAHETGILRGLIHILSLGVVLFETGSHYGAWAVLKLAM